MPKVSDLLAALERVAPAQYAFAGDKVGLQVGSVDGPCDVVVTSLDRSLAAVEYTRELGAQVLLSHHPLIWEPLKSVLAADHVGRTVQALTRNNISFVAAHTNWDAARGGINDTLAEMLGLHDVQAFGESARVERLQLVTFVPEAALQSVIDALSEAGAGVIGLYRRCAFYSPGTGTFLPLEGSDPAVGSIGEIEETQEVRLEMVVPAQRAEAAVEALRRSHPYEEPAFHLHQLWSTREQPAGRIGILDAPGSLAQFAELADQVLGTRSMTWGDPNREVKKVAIVGGAASGEWKAAKAAGADVLLTGEVPQHIALEASEEEFAVIAGGHYATENPGARRLGEVLGIALPNVSFHHYEPPPGLSGRPL